MRALCGAIIAAGALIGLGLTSLGIGTRYSNFHRDLTEPEVLFVRFRTLDAPLYFSLVFLALVALFGVAMTLLGLAYHHERRLREHDLALKAHLAAHPAAAAR